MAAERLLWLSVLVGVWTALALPDPRRAPPNRMSQDLMTNYLHRRYHDQAPKKVPGWPNAGMEFGQVSGVDVTPSADVIIFHRGNRSWTEETFDDKTKEMPENQRVSIREDTIVILNRTTGHVIKKFGANRFYVPHGLTVDGRGNLWLTDVGTHQVYRIPHGQEEPDLVLGEKFVPGSDNNHFCMPTDVAVASNGDFYVSDGYCNARILKFSSTGQWLGKFGMDTPDPDFESPYSFSVPHSVSLIEDLDILCVADREHQRVLCYNAGVGASKLGQFNRTIVGMGDIGRVYGLAYDSNQQLMYVAALLSEEPVYDQQGYPYSPARAFTYDLQGHFLSDWDYISPREAEQGPSIRHDIAVSPDGSDVYLADVLQRTVRKFSAEPADQTRLFR